MASDDDKLWNKVKDEYEENIQRVLILGFVHYYPRACESRLTEKMDLLNFCRRAMNEELSPLERGKALSGVENILRRLKDG